ncbi:MAG: phage tail tape measure protein [Actinomycetales bacterium]|uniref:Phage tail tape measure protein n=1 Tax=Candidatus Phosphoribacter hodrii TaxID=2953743 RepID=A0A935IMG0_9MICO|nr:phage tail tape measure protein [Candidatus Phosphoribacter hodrii]
MSTTDLLVRIESQFQDRGFKSAETSAKTLERELNKLEHAERAMANLQIQAAREDAVRTQTRLAAMEKVGRGATAMGVATAAGYALAAKAAMDWESAWTGVTKTVDGSASDMAKLQSELRGLANTLPTTHEQIAAVAEAAGQLGVKRADVAAFTRTMIDLGETTNLTSDEAATGLAKLGNIMGVLPSQASRAGSALVALGNDGASTEQDILAMALRIGAAGRTIGLTEAQVMGFASALSSVGIEAEAGGSAISRVFVDVAQAVDKGGVQVERFARVAGMSVDSFSEKFRTDAAGAVTAFVEGLGRVEASGGSAFQTLEDLGLSEIRVRDTLLRAANASDLLRTSVDLGTKAWTDNLALTQEASKRYETAESKIKMARNQLNNAAIDVGAVVLPAFASAAESVGSLAQWFSALPEPVKHTATVLGMVASAVTLVGGTALIAIPKIQACKVVLVEMGLASLRWRAGPDGGRRKTTGILGAAIGATTSPGPG